ncbi:response regulator transcription factor [Nocardioides limicola]|uniref:response regulator transcription factor n=1 Tax=Nocardioides limicola TaxID=2803368 RepID=UPI001EF01514|nr:response regulator transcription factor [Nocardioides sp. DJM-14]
MSDPLRIVIAEDHYLVREGTRRLLEDTGQVEVLAAVANAAELLQAVDEHRPAAVVTDIRMPPGHQFEGIEAAHEIRRRCPDTGVVVLSQHADAGYALLLLEQGSAGLAYLLKSRVADVEHLVFALREVVAGRSVVDATVVDELLATRRRAASSRLDALTPREAEVMQCLAEGMSNRGIAEALNLSVSSVEKYVAAVFAKLDLGPADGHDRRVLAVLTWLRES